MAQFIKEVTLDIDKDLLQTIDAKQNDVSSRFILFDLFCNSLPINLTDNSVQIYARKPDYSFIFNNVTIEDFTNGKVQVELTSQALAVVGTLNCELIITGSDNSILSTKPFNINVIESLKNDNAIESTNEFTALTTAVSTVTNYDSRITANTNHIGDLAGAGLSETDLSTAVKNDRTNMTNYVLTSALTSAIQTMFQSPAAGIWTGAMDYFPCTTPPTGYIERKGQILNRVNYPALWNFANNSGNIVDDSAWSSNKGSFSRGDGSTTFRVMDDRGTFIRSWDDGAGIDSGRTLGSYQSDDLKAHTHDLPMHQNGSESSGYGLTTSVSFQDRVMVGGAGTNIASISTGGTETRGKNYAYLACIHI